MKNLVKLHEAIVIALLSNENRTLCFDDIAKFIERRNLFPDGEGGINLSQQIMLRSTKSKKRYHYLFEQLDEKTIKLRNLD